MGPQATSDLGTVSQPLQTTLLFNFKRDSRMKISSMLWTSLIHSNGKQLAIMTLLKVYSLDLSLKVEWKLKTSFLKKFRVLENQFRSLLPPNVVKDEFEDFLIEKYDLVKDMNEAQFMQCLINEKSEAYSHFVRYLHWLMS